MNLIQIALERLDFHMFDRQGHELTLWHRDSEQQMQMREVSIDLGETRPGVLLPIQRGSMQEERQ